MLEHFVQCVLSSFSRLSRAVNTAVPPYGPVKKIVLRHVPLAFALGLAGVPSGLPAATPVSSPATTAAYVSDLRTYLDSVHWYDNALARVPHLNDPANREFFAAFAASMTPDRFYAKALPVFERYISPEDAHTLAALAGKRPVPAADQRAALASFALIEERAHPALAHVWDDLMVDFSKQNIERSVAELRRSIADMAAHDEPDYVPRVKKIGLSFLDQINSLTMTLYAKQWDASKLKMAQCAQASPEATLAPAAILAHGGFASAYRALDACERALETEDTSNQAAFQDFRTQALAIKVADRSSVFKEMERVSLVAHERTLQVSRMQHQIMEDQRRLVKLMDARRDHIHIDNGQLVFDTEEDLTQANRIIDDIVAHGEALNDHLQQLRQGSVLLRDIDLGDGDTGATTSAADAR